MASDAIIATLILAAMCVAMYLLARLAKRRMGIGSGVVAQNALRIVGKRPLDQKSALWVIEIAGGRHILLGSGVDGTVTKLDDITPEEYALMADEADAPAAARPRLRLAKSAKPDTAYHGPITQAEAEAATDAAEQRFATVGESFTLLMNKARESRNKKASGE